MALRLSLSLRILQIAEENNWEIGDLAKILRVHPGVVSKYTSGLHNFKLSEIVDMESLIGLNVLNI